MPRVILLSGPPCSGKSTWVQNYINTTDKEFHIISSDDLIDKMAMEYGCSYSELFEEAIKASIHVVKLKTKLALRLKGDVDVIIDSTNVNEKLRLEKVEKFKQAGFKTHLVYFVKPQPFLKNKTLVKLRERNNSRLRSPLDTNLIFSYYNSYEQPTEAELQKWDSHEHFAITL